MSEPYLKVWAPDMRADPKIARLIRSLPIGPYLLIQAWDLAKNGPVYGELRNDDATPMTSTEFADMIPSVSDRDTKRLFELLTSGTNGRSLAQVSEDGALVFPKLTRRQAKGKTPAQRQREYRERKRESDDSVTETVTESVTPNVTPAHNESDGQRDGQRYNALRARSREPEPEPQPEALTPLGQSLHETIARARTATATDQIDINAKDITGETKRAAEHLLAGLSDRDAGTAGRLVTLARAGAEPADFYDALQGIKTTRTSRPSRKACSIIEDRLRIRGITTPNSSDADVPL